MHIKFDICGFKDEFTSENYSKIYDHTKTERESRVEATDGKKQVEHKTNPFS